MNKLIIALIALCTILINPVLASDFTINENNDVIALQEYEMPSLIEEGIRNLNKQAEIRVLKTTWLMNAKLDLDLAQQEQTDQVVQNLKQEHHAYLVTYLQNTLVNNAR